ncbi:phosphopantetheine-binding protein [Trinickia acidisoli]|uniref:phosphopantetheine-binding protein n=1 Tax=Trinickia acidisoli TaxID=2767482 RepID=UPI001A9073FA|nr:phosphopantetheine-binding protein [Trinickia acidisoli]
MSEINDYQTPEEAGLASIFCEVLNLDRIERNAGYLELGGNSVSLYLILEKVKERYAIDLDPQLFFKKETSSLRELATALARQTTVLF